MSKNFSIEKITSTWDFSWNDQFVFDGESHRSWEVVFVQSGKVSIAEDESVYILGEDNIIFHAPMEFHKIRSFENSNPQVKVLSFVVNGELPENLKNGIFTLKTAERQEFLYTFEKAYKFFNNDSPNEYDQLEVFSRISAFLIRIARKDAEEILSNSSSATTYRQVVTSMMSSIEKNISITELAKQNFISVSYMKFLFAKYAGISPKSYQLHLRVQHADQLLKKGCSVLEVAEKMNFSSPNYFSSFYKNQTGVSPKRRS